MDKGIEFLSEDRIDNMNMLQLKELIILLQNEIKDLRMTNELYRKHMKKFDDDLRELRKCKDEIMKKIKKTSGVDYKK